MYEWVDFSKFPQIFMKILEKTGNFAQYLAQNWTDWYMNGCHFFLKKLVFVWVYFQGLWQHIPTKTKLEYPRWCTTQFHNHFTTYDKKIFFLLKVQIKAEMCDAIQRCENPPRGENLTF